MKTDRISACLNLRLSMWICIALWLAVQVAVVITVQDLPQTGDSLRYLTLATDCFNDGVWYPAPSHIEPQYPYSDHFPAYICYPGLINLLKIYMIVFGTYKAAFWMNIVFNCIAAASIRHIGRKLCGRKFADLSVCLFCMYPLQSVIVGETLSEIPCIALTYLSVALVCHKKHGLLAASAILIVAATYIRSVALLFGAAAILFMIVKKYRWDLILCYVLTAGACFISLLALNNYLSGHTFLSSTTLGVNMLIGANDDCAGTYNNATSAEPEIEHQLPGKNVFQIDSLNRDYAMRWIKANPGRWLSLAPSKLKYEFMPTPHITLGRPQFQIIDFENPVSRKVLALWNIYCNIYNYGIMVLAACGIWIRRRELLGTDGIILMPFICGIALTILTVGMPRYNMPYIPIMVYFGTWTIYQLAYKKRNHI